MSVAPVKPHGHEISPSCVRHREAVLVIEGPRSDKELELHAMTRVREVRGNSSTRTLAHR